ncbi:MAG: hypothetical protein EAZ27_01635 [Cytophagales bacterium]|nr:MAG: hypothetical protein EAZ27_01635 [Cytophagales bacterium]
MKLPAIKYAVENFSIEQLQKSETLLMDGLPLEIEITGDDEGEQLTHILSALWIKTEMKDKNMDYNTAFRAYMAKVRNSIN